MALFTGGPPKLRLAHIAFSSPVLVVLFKNRLQSQLITENKLWNSYDLSVPA
jgi:hypothetical protein